MAIKTKLKCPKCPSSDAYVEYEANFYCFSCHYSTLKEVTSIGPAKTQAFAEVWESNFPNAVMDDLRCKMHFTDALLFKYNIKYASELALGKDEDNIKLYTNRLIIPTKVLDNQVMYFEAKALGGEYPKYVSFGAKHLFKTFDGYADTVVLVEDLLSAMRIGEIMPCICLRGTNINHDRFIEITATAKNFVAWLDSDKPGQGAARILKRKLEWHGATTNVVTDKDPKYYSDQEIREYLSCTQ